jgi:predicted MFS family arabinose efflux permease
VTYGLIEGPSRGWSSRVVLLSLIAGVALLVAFLFVERLRAHPMLPLAVFRSRQFSAANAVTFIVYAALSGVLFLLPVVLQVVTGYSPLRAGSALLPVTAIMLALSTRSGALAARIGPRLQMTVGPFVIALGLALLLRLDEQGSYLTQVLPAMLVFGLGVAINVAPLTATALAAAPAEQAGVASAVNNDVARIGGLVAVAVLPALAGITGATFLHPAALLEGFHSAVVIAAATCAFGGVLAGLTIRNPVAARVPLDRARHCALEATPLRPDASLASAD